MPRHPSFKHEYWDGELHWTPRPHTCSVSLDLAAWQPPPVSGGRRQVAPAAIEIRRLVESDWADLPPLFRMAFAHWPPLSQWSDAVARRASRNVVEWTRLGRDGPLVPEACMLAHLREDREEGDHAPAGAALVTLIPAGRLEVIPAPPDALIPHLTWIFVSLWDQRSGVATRLLGSVVEELRALGYSTLASTVLTAQEGPMLWHWRNGFRLLGGW